MIEIVQVSLLLPLVIAGLFTDVLTKNANERVGRHYKKSLSIWVILSEMSNDSASQEESPSIE
jgi:hypothetical protein